MDDIIVGKPIRYYYFGYRMSPTWLHDPKCLLMFGMQSSTMVYRSHRYAVFRGSCLRPYIFSTAPTASTETSRQETFFSVPMVLYD